MRRDHSLLLWAPNQVHLALLFIYWLPMSSREEKKHKEKSLWLFLFEEEKCRGAEGEEMHYSA